MKMKTKKRGMRITKVYTRTGDRGLTRLAGGQRVWKDSERVEAYGTVDELNSIIGVVRACTPVCQGTDPKSTVVDRELGWIQNKLFDLGAVLATVPGQTFPNMPRISQEDVVRLERLIDTCQRDLPPLKEFILPGGSLVPSLLHLARTICRRAERHSVRLSRQELAEKVAITFLNRLSDALFVLARWITHSRDECEVLWDRHSSSGAP
ncbi:MAG: cob(I)yrinic acid a,c-diamide adenosyltransferase [Nitrospiraceae bacterium]